MIDVDAEVRRFVGERPPAEWAWMRDPTYRAQMTTLRKLLAQVELAMVMESIPEPVRLRVVRTALFGAPDPEEAVQRVRDHEQLVQLAMRAPADTAWVTMTEVRHS